ncbi:MAG TPA: hypothetical protein VJ801_15025 [Polyangia bacterium]|jgi:hypothetical protein|nr:hypothetical protein [Polyangia bacterium]
MSQIVDLTNAPNQRLRVALNVNGGSLTLNLRLYYNTQGGFWVLDISDQTDNLLVASVPLITGSWPAANILAPYAHLGIGSAFVINQSGAARDWPDDTGLGTDFVLIWDDTPGYSLAA